MRAILMAVLIAGILAGLAFLVTEAGLQAEAGAIVIGAVLGVAAAIPTSLLLLVVLTRAERRQMDAEGRIERFRQAGCQVVETHQPNGQIVYVVSASQPKLSHQVDAGRLLPAGQLDSLPARQRGESHGYQ